MADENDATQSIEVETYSAEQDVKQEAPAESTEAKEEVKAEAEQPAGEPEGKEAEAKKDDGVPDWAKRRFAEMTKARAEAERKAQALELELQQYKSPVQQQPVTDDVQQQQAPSYQVDPYVLAEQIAETKAFNAKCNDIYDKGLTEFQDFEAAISNFQMLGGLRAELIEAADATGNPAKVLYELGKNPQEAERIMKLSPARMGVELAKRATSAPAAKPISKAPAPISPVGGAARVSEGLADDLDDHEWIARRNRQLEAKRASR